MDLFYLPAKERKLLQTTSIAQEHPLCNGEDLFKVFSFVAKAGNFMLATQFSFFAEPCRECTFAEVVDHW